MTTANAVLCRRRHAGSNYPQNDLTVCPQSCQTGPRASGCTGVAARLLSNMATPQCETPPRHKPICPRHSDTRPTPLCRPHWPNLPGRVRRVWAICASWPPGPSRCAVSPPSPGVHPFHGTAIPHHPPTRLPDSHRPPTSDPPPQTLLIPVWAEFWDSPLYPRPDHSWSNTPPPEPPRRLPAASQLTFGRWPSAAGGWLGQRDRTRLGRTLSVDAGLRLEWARA